MFAVCETEGTNSFVHTGVISNWCDETRIPPATISQVFKYYLDITTPPIPLLLQQFALLAKDDQQKKRLEVLSKVNPCNLEVKLGFEKRKGEPFARCHMCSFT